MGATPVSCIRRALWSAGISLVAIGLASCGPQAPQTVEPAQETLQTTAPPAFTQSGLAALDARLQALAASEDRAGYVVVMARNGQQHVASAGYADREAGRPMGADTVMRIASMTKPVTAAAIMVLVEDGVIALDDPVSDYIPAFAQARVATSTAHDENYEIPTTALERPITIEDLLTHTSGIGYIFDYETNLGALYIGNDLYQAEGDMQSRLERVAELPLYFQPGQAWFYSYANDILGHVVTVASGQSLEAFCQQRFFEPLGMSDTTYFLREDQGERMAALYTHGEDGALVRVPDEQDGLQTSPIEAGGAGLWSTPNDFLRFAQMLANDGAFEGTRIMQADSVQAMQGLHVLADRLPDAMDAQNMAFGYSLGVTYDGPGEAAHRRIGDFGWGGYFDTNFVVSPSTGLVAVIMSQELPGPTTPETIGARAVFDELIYGALPTEA